MIVSNDTTSPSQVSYLGLEDSVDNDPCKFVLSCRGSAERFTLQAANVDIKQVWVRHIQEVLDAQSNFLSGERNCVVFTDIIPHFIEPHQLLDGLAVELVISGC